MNPNKHQNVGKFVQAGRKPQGWRLPALAVSALLIQPLQAQAHDDLQAALTGGKPDVDLRLRYETVDQDNLLNNAEALTLRTRIGYTSAAWHGFTASAQLESVSALIDDYAPEQAGYSVIADPEGGELNQWALRYAFAPGGSVGVGRHRINYDDARWVGNVGWRQNEQTFDGATFSYAVNKTLKLDAAYLTNVNTITATNTPLDGTLLHAAWSVRPALTLTAYAYLLDYEDPTATDFDTYGVQATGTLATGGPKLLYIAEYAAQDATTPAAQFSTAYLRGELGLAFKPVTVKLSYESLGSDGGAFALQTPLATKHAFQGWADLFLVTPAGGVDDLYASAIVPLGKTKLIGAYHEFTANDDSAGPSNYGSEIDLLLTRPLAGKLSGLVKYGNYSAEEFGVDTAKLWLELDFAF